MLGAFVVKNSHHAYSHGPRCRHASKAFFHIHAHHTLSPSFATSLNRLDSSPRQSPNKLSDNVRLRLRPQKCPYLPSVACPAATRANRISAPFSTLTSSNPHHPPVRVLMPKVALALVEEDLRSLLGLRTGDQQVRRVVTRTRTHARTTRERSEEASRPRVHPSLLPDMTMVPVPSFPTLSTIVPGASPASLTAISTDGESPLSAAANLPTVANPPSQCLPSHHPPTFPLPLVPGPHASTAQVAVPPLPVTND